MAQIVEIPVRKLGSQGLEAAAQGGLDLIIFTVVS
jgi:hypothetical protein